MGLLADRLVLLHLPHAGLHQSTVAASLRSDLTWLRSPVDSCGPAGRTLGVVGRPQAPNRRGLGRRAVLGVCGEHGPQRGVPFASCVCWESWFQDVLARRFHDASWGELSSGRRAPGGKPTRAKCSPGHHHDSLPPEMNTVLVTMVQLVPVGPVSSPTSREPVGSVSSGSVYRWS